MNETLLILAVTSVCCSLVGAILLMRQSLMIADAISHTVLLGIVLAFFLVPDLDSPFLMISAAILGVLTVLAIEGLTKSQAVRYDAAIGLIFPAFFSLAVILISRYFRNVHLDVDMVFLGEIIFAPFNRMKFGTISLPKALVYGIGLLMLNAAFIGYYYRILKLRLFDSSLATVLGISVVSLDILLMVLVSFTSVVSFQTVGAILVIALMAGPAMTAQLVSRSFPALLRNACLFAILNATIGYQLALYFNVSMTGMVATVTFLIFSFVLLGKQLWHIQKRIVND